MTDSVNRSNPRANGKTDPAGKGSLVSGNEPKLSVHKSGLSFDRVFSTAGVHPYDQVEWERRDVVQTNWRTGETVFEQRGVEYPTSWSVNASTIVTTKYFRGAANTDEREWSLRQLIDRVVGTYVRAGQEHGYFNSPEDAQIFEHELTWMLLNQVFSFNSPVWFNVGTTSPQQVSACQPYDALVSTPSGMIPIGKIVEDNAIGEKVYDSHGLTSVVAVKRNGVKQVLRIHTKAGHALDVTADHLVWRSSSDTTGRFVAAGELAQGDKLEWHRRDSFGEAEIHSHDIAEAALAGWMQSDGFVGQYDGTNRSLTIEAMTVTDAELAWVTDALDVVFPDVHRHERPVVTIDESLDCRRTRLYGNVLCDYVESWGLMARGVDMVVPQRLFSAPLPVVSAYLRSVFQAEGFVSAHERSTVVEVDMISESLIRGMQSLLARFGIFARVGFKVDSRENRKGCWTLRIQNEGDRRIFADEIGFIDPIKSDKLSRSFDLPGMPAADKKRLEISHIEVLGDREVFDIQTESGEYLSANLRVHNCFILAVDDTMDSILNWYREEGLIFKGGSGAGLNLSRIRSSKELLRSSGGTASGPVSFMRGADASAGTIKSGGATRRAAKMVVLDVDHPDIEEFIETKWREEEKIRALRDAGFDMELGGKDITSVQYQNANNSIRVSDEFMRGVQKKAEFALRGRINGEVIETVDAAKLFDKITEAAWACADPGIQYDDTINDWHTNPETGRITASNPCAEYMSLDNSSCNLASLNLLKFLKDDDTFDAQLFARAVEIVITAMDISICFADFPTEAIGDTTRAYRQLGIGYANLGALLMACGLGYESEGGRALAASITSLMTGTAYKRSAEIAGVVGPYDGFARNAEAHSRVMRKHAAATDAVRTVTSLDSDVTRLAVKSWEECLAIGAKNGWRNAQASVLAPTGCLSADTLVTTDRGMLRLSEIGDVYGDQWQDIDLHVATDEGGRVSTKFFVNGEEPTRRITTEGGYRIQGTLAHRVKVVDGNDGSWQWKRLAEINEGDVVPVQLGTLIGEPRNVPLPVLDQMYYAGDRHAVVPDHVDEKLAELVGYFMGDGSLHAKGVRFCVADTDLDVVERLRILGKELFGSEVKVAQCHGYQEVTLQSVPLARWWKAAGFAEDLPGVDHVGKGWTPRVPAAIRETNDPIVYAAFLRGLFEADGSVSEGVPALSTASELFAEDVRTLLLGLGLPTTTREAVSGWGGAQYQVRIRNVSYAGRFTSAVGFISERKDRLVARQAGTNVEPSPAAPGYIFEQVASNVDGGTVPTFDLSVPSNVTYVANGFISHNTIGFMMDCDTTGIEPDFSLVKFKKLVGGGSMQIVNQTIPRALRRLGYAEETVEAIVEHIGEKGHVIDAPGLKPEHYSVFDCAMGERSISPMGHVRMMAAVQPFISGAISKTVNMPEDSTIAEVKEIYTEGWRLGLKALAIYRDNCKVGQPLNDARAKSAEAKVQIEYRPVRTRLPKSRAARTVSFSVGGAEGYMTASSYPDGGVGEIFLKMSKQGSTLAGMMDAFSIAISIGLQYGVPLEQYVQKFTNMRFDPAGLTDDPDVRMAQSIMDYIFRRLALDFLPAETRADMGILTAEERAAQVAGAYGPGMPAISAADVEAAVENLAQTAPIAYPEDAVSAERIIPTGLANVHSSTELLEAIQGKAADAPLCFTCGTKMRPAGSCYVCEGCGSTSGCS